MSSGSGSSRVSRNNFPLHRSHSLDSVVLGAEEVLAGILQEVTFSERRNLTDRDWSGESIPRVRQQRMADALGDFGINLRRHYSFESDDSSFEIDMDSPLELRDAVSAEIARMRRNFESRHGGNDQGENLGTVDGLAANELPERPSRRQDQLRRDYDDLVARHNRMLEQFSATLQVSDGMRDIIHRRNEEIGAARTAEQAAEARAEAANARAVAAEARAEEAEEAAERERERADGAGRGQDRAWLRNRRRTNFGEDDYNIDVTLKIIKEFDGNDPTKLEGFLRNCKLVFSRVRERDHPYVLELILTNKLTDRAMRDMKYKEIQTMEQLETELEALYGTKKSIDSLQMELSTLRQREGETVSSYGSRTERITAELVDELSKTKETLAEKRTVEDAIRQCAKASFESGLNGQLQVLVRARNFKTLHESVIGAIDLAKTINLQSGKVRISDGRRSEKTCYRCDLAGHFARDCPTQQASSRLPRAEGKKSMVMPFNTVCKYCRYTGHEALDCHKLKKKLGIPEGQKLLTGTDKSNTPAGKQNVRAGNNNQDDLELPIGAFQIS